MSPVVDAHDRRPLRIILLGAPGAGKGTQGALLAERRGFARIATGDLLRDALRRGTPLGLQAKRYMDAGELVPDDVILAMIRELLHGGEAGGEPSADAPDGFILDGFPRTLPQAEALDRLLEELSLPLDAVIVIDVPEEILIERLSGRRTCARCGAVYNVHSDPASPAGPCAQCGGELVQRKDDEPETVRRRLEVYRRQTEPLIAYYRRRPIGVVTIDGDRPVPDVQQALEGVLAR